MEIGQVAYEACRDSPHKRVSWEQLSEDWKDYWRVISKAVKDVVVEDYENDSASQRVRDKCIGRYGA